MARDAAVTFIQEKLNSGQPVYGYEVDDVSREVIIDAGFGDAILHRTGHSLGNRPLQRRQHRQSRKPGSSPTDFGCNVYARARHLLAQLQLRSPVAKGIGIRTEINCLMHEGRVEVTTLPLQTEVIALL